MQKNNLKPRYSYFLIGFGLLFLTEPLLSVLQADFPAASLLFILIMIVAFSASGILNIRHRASLFAVGLAIFGLVIEYLNNSRFLHMESGTLTLMIHGIYAYFIVHSIVVLTVRIFSEKSIDLDALSGGIFIYFLIGILWVALYRILLQVNPEAFNVNAKDSLFYFSYTTLTTLGYGDIYPKSQYARILCNAEAIAGQIFLAVFIARLVGLYIVQEITKEK